MKPTWEHSRHPGLDTRSGSTSSRSPTAPSRTAARATAGSWRCFLPRAIGAGTPSGSIRRCRQVWRDSNFPVDCSTGATGWLRSWSRRPVPVLHNPTRGNFLLPNVPQVRAIPGGVGGDLRALRRAGRDRAGPGDPRVRLERHAPLGGAGDRLLSVARDQLEAPESAGAGRNRRLQPDHPGAVLRSPPDDSRNQIRLVHSGALGAQRRRHERRVAR